MDNTQIPVDVDYNAIIDELTGEGAVLRKNNLILKAQVQALAKQVIQLQGQQEAKTEVLTAD